MSDPKTVAEKLDAAAAVDDNGEAFGGVILGFFAALDKARWAEEDTDDE
jgi:hypothetical protein